MFDMLHYELERDRCASCVNEYKHDITHINANLYIGNYTAARCRANLVNYDIEAIINVSGVIYKPCTENYLEIPIDDKPNVDLSKYYDQIYNFIEQHSDKNILVHCMAGISRSASFVIYYFMKKNNLQFDDAYRYVKMRRPVVKPNYGFVAQLSKCRFFVEVNI